MIPANQPIDVHQSRLLRVVTRNMPQRLQRRLDPEDIVQSVFRSFVRRCEVGKIDHPDIRDVGAYLVTMALNKVRNAIEYHQQQKRDLRREAPLIDDAARSTKTAVSHVEDVALADFLEQLLQGLPEVHREIVLLRLAGYSVAEIAAGVSRSERTVFRVLESLENFAREE